MRLFQRKNGTWYIEISRNERKSLKTKDKAVAQQIYEKAEEEYWQKRIPEIIDSIVSDFTRRDVYGDIYFIQAEPDGLIKIGWSNNLPNRFSQLKNMIPLKVRLLAKMRGNMKQEEEIHGMFAKYRQHGEWFRPVPELLEYINNVNAMRKKKK